MMMNARSLRADEEQTAVVISTMTGTMKAPAAAVRMISPVAEVPDIRTAASSVRSRALSE
jgi:hypothetical protein